MKDISPDFVWNKLDTQIIAEIIPLAKTPRAIRAFSNKHRPLSDYAYWFLLGTLWVDYTGWSSLDIWKRLFQSPRPNRSTSLMKPSELSALEVLPEQILAYRAHRPNEIDWLSYTIDPQEAGWFAAVRGVDRVTQYVIAKDDLLALFTRRGESELLLLDKSKATRIQDITVYPAARQGQPRS